MKKQGRIKHQTSKQLSSNSPDSAVNFLWTFFGENVMSTINQLARECEAVRPTLERFPVLCSEQPEVADSLRPGVEDTIKRAGRFLICADVKTLQDYVKARIELVDQGQRPVDRVRTQLILSHQLLSQRLRRSPTVAELREAAAKIVTGLAEMDESQFRRTINELGLEMTFQKSLNKLRTTYRQTRAKLGRDPKPTEFFTVANKVGSYAYGMNLDDFVEICMADGMKFSNT